MLVRVDEAKVILAEGLVTPPTTGFHITNIARSDTIFVSNLNGVLNPFVHPLMGSTVRVTGILHYANNGFRICPRNYGDIVQLAGVGNKTPKIRFAVVQNPSARPRLSFGLPQASDVELGVYDVTGRQIRDPREGHLPAGEYSRAWNGLSANGTDRPRRVLLSPDGQRRDVSRPVRSAPVTEAARTRAAGILRDPRLWFYAPRTAPMLPPPVSSHCPKGTGSLHPRPGNTPDVSPEPQREGPPCGRFPTTELMTRQVLRCWAAR